MHLTVVRLCCYLAAVSSLAAAPDPLAIVEQALRLNAENDPRVRQYSMTQEVVEREMGPDGQVRATKRKTYEIVPLGGEPYSRLIRRDGRPLPPEDARREQQKFEDAARKRAAETPEQRRRRLASYEEKLARRREMLEELPKAFSFRLSGEETLDGHDCWIIEADPRPGYQPRSIRTSVLTKMQGRMHVSKELGSMMKIDVVTTGPVSFGFFLAKLAPGTRMTLEQMRLPDGVWVVKRFKMNYDAKIALIKQVRGENEQINWDFHKPATVAAAQ